MDFKVEDARSRILALKLKYCSKVVKDEKISSSDSLASSVASLLESNANKNVTINPEIDVNKEISSLNNAENSSTVSSSRKNVSEAESIDDISIKSSDLSDKEDDLEENDPDGKSWTSLEDVESEIQTPVEDFESDVESLKPLGNVHLVSSDLLDDDEPVEEVSLVKVTPHKNDEEVESLNKEDYDYKSDFEFKRSSEDESSYVETSKLEGDSFRIKSTEEESVSSKISLRKVRKNKRNVRKKENKTCLPSVGVQTVNIHEYNMNLFPYPCVPESSNRPVLRSSELYRHSKNEELSKLINTDIQGPWHMEKVLDEMLRNQINLTKHFIQSHHDMYLQCCRTVKSLNQGYKRHTMFNSI